MDPRSADPSLQKTSPTHGSSGSPGEHWPGMNIAQLLLWLKQGTRSLEEYIREYLDVAYGSDLPDCVLIDFFCEGVNQPLKKQLIREGPRSSLSQFLDYALLNVGSPFTVGVAEECDTSSGRVMAAAPDDTHKMAATTTTIPSQVQVKLPESRPISTDLLDLHHVSGSVWERCGLRSSVADPPLTSARAAGIPKPPPAASHSSSPVATHSSSPVAAHSSSPVATHSSSPVATHSSSPVATHSNSLDAMDKMAALPVPTGKMAAPPVSGNIGVVPASESAPPREPAAAPTEEVGTEPPPQPCKRRRRRKKASSSPQGPEAFPEPAVGPEAVPEQPAAVPEQPAAVPEQSALPDTATEAGAELLALPAPTELLALPAPPELLALPAPPELLTHETATASVEFPKNFFGGGHIPEGGELVGGDPARPRSSAASELLELAGGDLTRPRLPKPPDLPWLPKPPDLPWAPKLPDLPWPPDTPDPPWLPLEPDPPWLPVAPDPPWLPVAPDPPWLPVAPDPPWLPEFLDLHWRPRSRLPTGLQCTHPPSLSVPFTP
ncbi:uncharacterized protein LOC127494877 [Ctenopharyngodon idella]|uniref:uncharacterized protein LOC127494877 n=1 Tax=Ctenopharyngodon idella TaxID=7959 RepID=UPI002230F207|nr:uncharacterized protein LOC127494877 [Ctenopharyngodon idella]